MPNRILKESICTSDNIDALSWFEEIVFYRLIVSCDDFGRFDGRPAIIKNRLFPLKENLTLKSVSAAIDKLARVGLVALYEFEGKPYLHLPTWNEHQSVRAKRSKYPDPTIACKQMSSDEIKCKQMQADVPVIQSNPNPIRNPNPNAFADFAAGDEGILKALADFEQMRNKIKKPMTDRAKKLLCTELQKHSGGDRSTILAIIDQSIVHSWANVYPLKGEKSTSHTSDYSLGEAELASIASLERLRDSLKGDSS